jgi:hypothetical protein
MGDHMQISQITRRDIVDAIGVEKINWSGRMEEPEFLSRLFNLSSLPSTDGRSVLRDYRNYVHPQKQLSHGVHLKSDDAKLFWEVSKSIARQVIDSAS